MKLSERSHVVLLCDRPPCSNCMLGIPSACMLLNITVDLYHYDSKTDGAVKKSCDQHGWKRGGSGGEGLR
eukprot:5264038-Prymnesium_polylepis.1